MKCSKMTRPHYPYLSHFRDDSEHIKEISMVKQKEERRRFIVLQQFFEHVSAPILIFEQTLFEYSCVLVLFRKCIGRGTHIICC
jgi:hypothetical protein